MVLSDISIRRPVTTLTITGAFLIFGWIAFKSMGIDLNPDVEMPYVTVTTTMVGASPEIVDENITDVLEDQIKTISSIKTLTSQSYEGLSIIAIEFELDKNVDVAAEEVRAKVNLAKNDLPVEAKDPIVDKLDIAAQPVLWVAVYGNVPYSDLVFYADKVLKEQIQSVKGVGNIQMGGLREREIRVWLDPEKLQARGLTANDVVKSIQARHVELPGGRIETDKKEYTVLVQGEYDSVEEMKSLVVAKKQDGVIMLKDVGRLDDSFEDRRTIARYNGIPAIELGMRKQSGTNSVAVAEALKARLEEIKKTAPKGISVSIAFDTSEFIVESMSGVQFDIIFGVLLTGVLMFLFLRNLRTTIISMVSIPVSLIGGFIIMNAMDFTINNMTMLGMSLAVGMVIDDTIVVLENIYRHVEDGATAMTAAKEGTDQVGLAVLAATSTVAAVFIPVAFMKGIIGRFFFQFGLTVALTIIISALVSLTLTPFLCSRLIQHQKSQGKFYVTIENFFTWLERTYTTGLEWSVIHRKTIVAIAVIAFAAGLFLTRFIGSEFITASDESRFLVRFELPTGTSINEADRQLRQMEKIVFERPEVVTALIDVGSGASQEVNKGTITLTLVPKDKRKLKQQAIMNEVRDKFAATFKGLIFSVEYMSSVGGGRSADITYVIQGPSVAQLGPVTSRILDEINSKGVFVDVDSDLRMTKPQVQVSINRKLANDLDVDVISISNEIYTLFGGVEAAKFKDGGYAYKIRVKAMSEFRGDPTDLDRIVVKNRSIQIINAPNLFNYIVGQGPNVINRYNRMRSVTIYANVKGIPSGEGLKIVDETAKKHMPKDGNWMSLPAGMSQIMGESFEYLFQAIIVAILVIYMVLAVQFESFVHPLTIMLSLPLTLIGVFGALLITGKTLNIFSFIGIIMLMGIVTKNGILMVDFANQERERGLDKVKAILRAGPIRLRPILMTATAAMIGVLPVALALSEGGESRAPMAVAVIGGLMTSTFLTLFVIPVVYLLLDDAVAFASAKVASFGSGAGKEITETGVEHKSVSPDNPGHNPGEKK